MSERLDDAAADWAAFRTTGSLAALKAAVVGLQGLGPPAASEDETAREERRTAAGLWLGILAAIDERIDPEFDPEDVPERKVRKTADPAAFEAADRANVEKAERYSLQTQLRRLDERATPAAESFLRTRYPAGDAGPEGELDELLAAAGLSLERETGLRASRSVDSTR